MVASASSQYRNMVVDDSQNSYHAMLLLYYTWYPTRYTL